MKVIFYGDVFMKMRDTVLSYMKGHDVDILDGSAIEEKISSAEVLVTRPSIKIGGELLRRAKRLELMQMYGTGLEGVDFDVCREQGIAICNTPSAGTGNAEGVAEIMLLHMLLLGRKYSLARENALSGRFFSPKGISLWRKTVCVIGLGNLGRVLSSRISAMGASVRGVNRSRLDESLLEEAGVSEFFPLNRLHEAVSGCRFVVAALALTDETRGMFDEAFFRAMDRGSFFINVARGGLVDEPALIRALVDKHLAGAGLDVLDCEPPRTDNPLLFHPSVTMTPHIGGATDESVKGIMSFIRENIDRLSRGEAPLSRQN
ncbi:MAG: 2-hydroxyacid dehydrogenase [Synergistaceae bacterium]|jgi:phosphoglycerate dehydrogenase-like enzyme|nr:2-hydroxyacid dehydrogenase [Synergistaceae bacterium]